MPGPRHIPWISRNGAPALSIEVLPWSWTLTSLDVAGRRPAAILLFHDLRAKAAPEEDNKNQGPVSRPRNRTRAELFAAVTQDIENHCDDSDLSLSWLASRHGISPRRLRDLFYAENTNFTDYLLNLRLERARDMLLDAGLANINVASIAFDCGFGDISWFHHTFRRRFKMTPTEMRNRRTKPE
nr:AraC family transcriptional regulator [Lutimaribacter sp. EGI FJ00013]